METRTVLAAALTVLLVPACTPLTASVPMRWAAPTENEDGSRLEDLAGYHVYWKRAGATEVNCVAIDDAGTTSYVIEGLEDGEWHVGISAITESGIESNLSTAKLAIEDGEIIERGAVGRIVRAPDLIAMNCEA